MAGFRLIVVSTLLLFGCEAQAPSEAVVFDGLTMGTTYTVKVAPPLTLDRAGLAREIGAILDGVDGRMSTYKPESELSRLNFNPSLDWIELSPELASILSVALEIARLSGGAFDVTIGPLVNLWGFGPGDRPRQVPDNHALDQARQRVGYDKLLLDPAVPALGRQAPDVYIDLSGIAQGFGADAVGRHLTARGMRNFMVDVSGEIMARGVNAAGNPWRIGIERPVERGQSVERVIELRDISLATSGDYRNYFEENGTRYSHLIDPATGRPITHRLASVTVLSPSTTRADGLATALMVMGPDRGFELAMREQLPALFIMRTDAGFEERWTPFLESYLKD
ncbi:MAG: FAD:protein FMN transferase [Gammaproteobacteria bacterium]|nr:FAD:protein FMN transferase [Gammaproteobacteria bacterium]